MNNKHLQTVQLNLIVKSLVTTSDTGYKFINFLLGRRKDDNEYYQKNGIERCENYRLSDKDPTRFQMEVTVPFPVS